MAAGSAPVEFLVRDAEATDLPDAAFDLVLCSNGMAYLEVKLDCFDEYFFPCPAFGREALGQQLAASLLRQPDMRHLTHAVRSGFLHCSIATLALPF